ncbi:ABC transporter substrate-binding protein [Cohnella silvisoli]|uniref:Sugar ABC transporter substrate-binding protein n=1 Tax=Cohnella silvisoli TaxID=2873699 RepID=A0ABV1L0N9_9BACL|nr:sugar ABC transporter substrate-binding protein [Cohnella silvisoli]MCD9024248.1 sugar ABC transporter substrate-binding protein [Cohnella silvisoli]
MKKSLPLLLLLALITTILAGCQSKNDVSPDTASETTGQNAGKETEITMVTLSDYDKYGLNDVISSFEKANPTIKVKLEMYPFNNYFETLEVKLGSRSTDYDLIMVDGPLISNYTVKGYLAPLDSYLKPEQWNSKWVDSSVKAGTYNGKLMAAPMDTSTQVLYYNKDLFEQKGITPPSSDPDQRWTWEQVVDAAAKLTYDTNGDGQNDVFGFGFEQVSRAYQILSLSDSLGAKPLSDDGLVATGYTNSDKFVQAGKFYYDLFHTSKVSPKTDQTQEYFKTGKLAMLIGGTWDPKIFAEAKVNFGIALHPYFAGQKAATPTGSWHLGISETSGKKEAAAKFIEYLTLGEGAKIWFEKDGSLPANVDVLNAIDQDPKYDQFPNNLYRIASYEAKNTAVSRPVTPGYLDWESLYFKAFEDIRNGIEPKQALDGIVTQMDRQLKKYE